MNTRRNESSLQTEADASSTYWEVGRPTVFFILNVVIPRMDVPGRD